MTRTNHKHRYDIIVVGGGHAGAEAAWAAAGLGATVALVTMDCSKIGAMSCNPAIGGLAKGQIVREIDALGGIMGRAIDATGIQFRMLNTSRGAAVHGPRAQADKYAYAAEIQRILNTRQIDCIEACVDHLIVDETTGRCTGVIINDHPVEAGAVILTTGTFMRGLMHVGEDKSTGGRVDEASAEGISTELRRLGFELGRLKTGTPARLAAETINFEGLAPQPGDANPIAFSEMSPTHLPNATFPELPQIQCHTTYTNEIIHEHIRANLHRAPMYCGDIDAESGPRYCPSIEDKVVRFKDRDAHHVFLEPESLTTNEVYCNGISTSLPKDVQDFVIHHLPGCEHAKILKYGYAVEYDVVWPHQIDATTMTKTVVGLFLAGQINGTSGYEEAGAQGLIAGLNAVRHTRNEEPIRLGRGTSYIGVMLDDLVTKKPREPYRMFTSRAEFRLKLRADNAPDRLTEMAHELGLICSDRWELYQERRLLKAEILREAESVKFANKPLTELPKRGDVKFEDWYCHLPAQPNRRIAFVVFNDLRYANFIIREENEAARIADMETRPIPDTFDYHKVSGLRNEAVEVLSHYRPATFGQAGRLAGVNPADISLIAVALRAMHRAENPRASGHFVRPKKT